MSDLTESKNSIMPLNNKFIEFGRHFLIYGVGSALQGLVTFMLLPLLSTYFTVDDYGRYSLIILVGNLLGSFFYLGGQTAIIRFYFEEKNDVFQSRVVTNTLVITLIGAFLCIIIGFTSSTILSQIIFESDSYWKVFALSSFAAAMAIINTYLITYLRLIKKSTLFIIANLVSLLLNFISTYLFLKYDFFSNSLVSPFVGQIIGLAGSIFLSFYPIIKYFKKTHLDLVKIRSYFMFSFPIVLMGLIRYLFEASDRFVMESYLSLAEVGIYSFGYKLGTIVNLLFIVPFGLIFSILRMEYSNENTNVDFFKKTLIYFSLIGFTIVLLLTISIKIIISLATDSYEYQNAFIVAPWILVGQLILGYAGIFDYGIYKAKKTYYYFTIYGIAFVFNIILNLIFLKYFGLQFAAINKMISYLFLVILIYYFSNKYFEIPIEKRFLKLLLSFVFAFTLVMCIMHFNFSFYYYLMVMFLLLTYWYKAIIDSDEKKFMLHIKNKIKSKKR